MNDKVIRRLSLHSTWDGTFLSVQAAESWEVFQNKRICYKGIQVCKHQFHTHTHYYSRRVLRWKRNGKKMCAIDYDCKDHSFGGTTGYVFPSFCPLSIGMLLLIPRAPNKGGGVGGSQLSLNFGRGVQPPPLILRSFFLIAQIRPFLIA